MIRIIILAAGKGKRMGGIELPKVLRPLAGRPMLEYVLDAVQKSGIGTRPIIVIGHLSEKVREACGDTCDYALQTSLRGTGDAVRSAREEARDAEHIMVLNGDMPFVKSESIRKILETHKNNDAVMTMGSVLVEDFSDWRSPFADFGRIVRNENGKVLRITEMRDADQEVLNIKEVNPSIFCFKASWLWKTLETLTTENAQGEFYITDLLEKAIASGEKVETVPIEPLEAIGINTPDQLIFAEQLMSK